MPLVSLIMTVRNGERYLTEAILSLLEQSFKDTEVIVVNNGSTDGTSEILTNMDDPRVRVITVDPSLKNTFASGISKACNAAVGKYIAVQDSDDISYNTRIEKQANFLETHQDVGLVASKCTIINQFGEYLFTSNDFPECNELMQKYAEGNFLTHSTIMFRQKIAKEIGGYNKNFEFACDYRLALDILYKGYKISGINEPLIKSRRHDNQETVQANNKIKQNQDFLTLLEYAQNLPFLNKKSLAKGRRQITKAKFQASLNLLRQSDRRNAWKLFGVALIESPFYLMIYALNRAIRGQLNDAPRPGAKK